ncbi:extracellular solute-binding protein [Candidatus Aerophobetes bacterium]|nr:extracellular solute-binding protein [Candidatus Aerophobetes bacterium]
MKRKPVLLVLGILLCVGLFASTVAQAQDTTLRVWNIYTGGMRKEAFDKIVKEFESQYPNIKVEQRRMADEPYGVDLQISLGKPEGPDVYFVYFGDMANQYLRADKVLVLDDYLAKDNWKDSFEKAALSATIYKGKTIGIATDLGCKQWFYNKESFDALGLNAPETWDEWMDASKKAKTGGYIPILFANKNRWPASHWINVLNQKICGEAVTAKDYDPLYGGDFTDPGYVEALKRMDYVDNQGFFNEGYQGVTYEESQPLFAEGMGTMFWSWTSGMMDYPPKFEWGLFTFPAIPEGKGDQSYIVGGVQGFCVAKDSQNREEAIQFLRFITRQDIAKMWVQTGKVSAVKGATTEETVPMKETLIDKRKIEQAGGIEVWLDRLIEVSIAEEYMNVIQGVLMGDMSAEEGMQRVRKVAQEVKVRFAGSAG